jgi:hypothetical protein
MTMTSDDTHGSAFGLEVPAVVGVRLKAIRAMTQDEADEEGWARASDFPLVLEFENGVCVYASRDDEGNGPGVLFGRYQEVGFYVKEEG